MTKKGTLLFLLFILLFSMVIELTAQTPTNGRWHHPLFLDNNNYWKKRAVLTVTGADTYEGAYVYFEVGQAGNQLNLIGADLQSVRVCTESGLEVAYACFNSNLNLAKTGEIQAGYRLTIPLECQKDQMVKYYIYYDNSSAGEVRQCCTYKYVEADMINGTTMVQSVDYESITLSRTGKKIPTVWYDDDPADSLIWEYRVPIIVANFSNTSPERLTIVNLTRFEKWKGAKINMNSLRIVDSETGTELPYYQAGIYTSFYTTMPTQSYKYFHAYFSTDENVPAPVTLDYTDIAVENKVLNPAFIQTTTDQHGVTVPRNWTFQTYTQGTTYGIKQTGLFGLAGQPKNSIYNSSSAPGWSDWSQGVAVDPASLYLFTCWMKLETGSGFETPRLVFTATNGNKCEYKENTDVQNDAVPGGDWALCSLAVSTPDDIATLGIYLKTQEVTTVEYDGVLLNPVNYGEIDNMQINPILQTGSDVQMWGVPTIEKVFPDNPPPQTITALTASAAQKERESMQVAIRSTTNLPALSINISSLSHVTEDAQLSDIEIAEILYVPIDAISGGGYVSASSLKDFHRKCAGSSDGMIMPRSLAAGNDAWIGLWPDPIKPCEGTLDLTADITKSLLVTVNVPEGLPAGIYRGTLELKEENPSGSPIVKASVDIEFRVWGFEIPENNTLIAQFDLKKLTDPNDWLTITAAKYLIQEGIIPSGLTTEQILNKLYLYYPMMWEKYKKYRIEPDHPNPEPIYDYDNDTVDDAGFDVATDLYFNTYNFQNMYSPFSTFLKGGQKSYPRYMLGTPYSYDAQSNTIDPLYEAKFRWALGKYQSFLQERNLKSKSWLYLWDEPINAAPNDGDPQTNEHVTRDLAMFCDIARDVDSDVEIYVSGLRYYEELNGKVDVYGIFPNEVISEDDIEKLRATGTKIMYSMDGKYNLDTPYYGSERVIPYFCKTKEAIGFEYWGTNFIPSYNPFKWPWLWTREDAPTRFPSGDGYLFYMGELNGKIELLPTTRIDQIREGIEDYEYIHILQEFVDRGLGSTVDLTEAQAILTDIDNEVNTTLYPGYNPTSSTNFIKNPDFFTDIKNRMGALIERIQPENMLINGDFTNDYANWETYKEWWLNNDVSFTITPEKSAQVQIINGGNNAYSIQLYQAGLTIEQNAQYTVSFKASASVPRSINAIVGMIGSPYTSYSNVETANLTTDMQTYTFTFTMQNATDSNARLEFELGVGNNVNITIDDVMIYKNN